MDESDYSYVASAITIIGTVGAIWGIKLYKKEKKVDHLKNNSNIKRFILK